MVGDIWLTRNHGSGGVKGWFSRQIADMITLIKHGKHTGFNHAMPEGENGMLLDAGWSGVRLRPKENWIGNKQYSVLVIRRELDPAKMAQIAKTTQSLDGASYGKTTMLAHLFGRKFARWVAERSKKDWICSEVTAQVHYIVDGFLFMQWGHQNTLDPNAVRPRDIEWSLSNQFKPDDGQVWREVARWSHGKEANA